MASGGETESNTEVNKTVQRFVSGFVLNGQFAAVVPLCKSFFHADCELKQSCNCAPRCRLDELDLGLTNKKRVKLFSSVVFVGR